MVFDSNMAATLLRLCPCVLCSLDSRCGFSKVITQVEYYHKKREHCVSWGVLNEVHDVPSQVMVGAHCGFVRSAFCFAMSTLCFVQEYI